jgi:hypothetical protein
MPTYRITRLWSLSGYTTSEVHAESEEQAQQLEADAWDERGAFASLPPALAARVEETYDEVESIEELRPSLT